MVCGDSGDGGVGIINFTHSDVDSGPCISPHSAIHLTKKERKLMKNGVMVMMTVTSASCSFSILLEESGWRGVVCQAFWRGRLHSWAWRRGVAA